MLQDRDTFISGKGTILEAMLAGMPIDPGLFIWEDAPFHTFHRARLSRVFTPRAVLQIEQDVRDFCARTVDTLVGREQFDMMADFAREIPMRVMGLLLGIPEADQPILRDHFLATMHRPMGTTPDRSAVSSAFNDYVDWRVDHPADDLMTSLLETEFEDETGTTRRLHRAELLTYLNLIAAAGNDTTGLLIGWTARVLSDNPEQRAELVEDPHLIPGAIEEVLRYENPAYAFGRTVEEDAVFHGQTVPAGSVLLCVGGAPNRDERQFGEDAERFDIHRKVERHISFGYGVHFCLGANLARLEARVALEELLRRTPNWQVVDEEARLVHGGPTRGYEYLPVIADR
jgi:cytochrome P450